MPEHYAIDSNVLMGSVHLGSAKSTQVEFKNSSGNPVSFTKEPYVQLTLKGSTTVPPYKVKPVKNGNVFVGFIIGFPTPQTIDIDWQVSKRGD